MSSFSPEMVEQHADDAVSLFMLRERAANSLGTTLSQLTKLDSRLDANLGGLCLSGEAGWEQCLDLLSREGASAAFPAAVLACASGQEDRLRSICRTAADHPGFIPIFVAALSWLDPTQIASLPLAPGSADVFLQELACAALISHGVDPGDALAHALQTSGSGMKDTLVRGVGELGRADLVPLLRPEMSSADEACRFWAAWSTLLLTSSAEAKETIGTFAHAKGRFQEEAVAALTRREGEEGAPLADVLHRCSANGRLAIVAVKERGQINGIAFLLEQMSISEHARFAAEAFTHITGAPMEDLSLTAETPQRFEFGPTEDPEDERVCLDPDDGLPWPDVEMTAHWWKKHSADFQAETRYLCGRPITGDWLQLVLRHGRQGQRAAAALQWASARPPRPVFNIRAAGFRQAHWLNPQGVRDNLCYAERYRYA